MADVILLVRLSDALLAGIFAAVPDHDAGEFVIFWINAEAAEGLRPNASVWQRNNPPTFATPDEQPDEQPADVDQRRAIIDQMLADNMISVHHHTAMVALLAL